MVARSIYDSVDVRQRSRVIKIQSQSNLPTSSLKLKEPNLYEMHISGHQVFSTKKTRQISNVLNFL